jgi:hypothetical protein
MELLNKLTPEIVGLCVYFTDIKHFAERYIKEQAEIDIKIEITIKEDGKNIDLLVSFITEISEKEDQELLNMQIDYKDPIFTGGTIVGKLFDEIDGYRFIPGIGEDDELGKYILVEVPFDKYMEEIGYSKNG